MTRLGPGTSGLRQAVAALMAVVVVVGSAAAQSPQYPTAAQGSVAAQAGFAARADAVIAINACGREADYAHFLGGLKAGNFDNNMGEYITAILIAKAAFARNHPHTLCKGQIASDQRASLPACALVTKGEAHQPQIDFAISRDCMSQEIDDAVLAMRKTKVLGSSKLPCLTTLSFKSHGEFDIDVRELIRLLYIAGPGGANLLGDAAVHHMDELLATRGAPSDDSYSVLTDCAEPAGDEVGSPEDTADRYKWYNELGQGFSDALKWLATALFKSAIFAAVQPASLAAAPFLIVAGVDPSDLLVPAPFADIRVPETENHRLMIESSKYLVNADMIARLEAKRYGGVDDWKDDQAKVREWLLRRLQDIAIHDFREYNSRAYTRYSLEAILNLYDFGATHGDTAMKTAAWIVLDLSEAKFAATSNRGRRTSPFRRKASYDGYATVGAGTGPTTGQANLYNIVEGADHEVLRAMLLSDQTQLLPDARAPNEAIQRLVNPAVSAYRLPGPVLATAVDRGTFEQSFVHAGVEHVFQAPGFTITAGGVPTAATASLFGKSDDDDFGVAMPTTIIPTIAGLTLDEVFRFDGVGIGRNRTGNICVAPGFACGLQPSLSKAFVGCTDTPIGDSRSFATSHGCPKLKDAKPAFYLASRTVDCDGRFCLHGHRWGVMDIVEAPSAAPADFARFKAERGAALDAVTPDGDGRATYTTAAGLRIDFTVAASRPTVLAVNGVPPPPLTVAGGVVDGDGHGHMTIKGPGGPITIDFTDWANPKRTGPPPPSPPQPGQVVDPTVDYGFAPGNPPPPQPGGGGVH